MVDRLSVQQRHQAPDRTVAEPQPGIAHVAGQQHKRLKLPAHAFAAPTIRPSMAACGCNGNL
jgi:hypothetical protein